MVRHHKKKKGSSKKQKQPPEKEIEAELENLDRFAGSSDDDSAADAAAGNRGDDGDRSGSDEESSDESENDDREGVAHEPTKEAAREPPKKSNESADESEESDGDYANDEYGASRGDSAESKSLGMANAMSRILGLAATSAGAAASKPKPDNVVLSRTTTPLQRLRNRLKSEEAALRLKRRERRSENLTAMRLPLAPTAGMSAEKLSRQKKKRSQTGGDGGEGATAAEAGAVAAEIESERTHRRIATRGVVALFNAISKHRARAAEEARAREEEKARIREEGRGAKRKVGAEEEKSATKHGFLEMIKSAASAERGEGGGGAEKKVEGKGKEEKGKSVGWNALKDDFMMNSKLKDWDKELSDDDEDDEPSVKVAPSRKKLKA